MISQVAVLEEVVYRPKRIRWVAGACALAVVVLFTAISFSLKGSSGFDNSGTFERGDQTAMIGLGILIALGILTVGCGFYFYLKVVKAMYWQPAPADATAIPVSRLSLVTMWIMVGLIFALGIFPQIAVGLLPR